MFKVRYYVTLLLGGYGAVIGQSFGSIWGSNRAIIWQYMGQYIEQYSCKHNESNYEGDCNYRDPRNDLNCSGS